MRTELMITVRDVQASSAWYCQLFGAEHDHDSEEFDRILHNGKLLVMLNQWGGDEHGPGAFEPGDGAVGHGVVLWFLVEDLDLVLSRAADLEAEIVVQPHENPLARWRQVSLRDPDGYTITVAETGWDT
jgi:catechol 2,3-dioxygenase-like lactoylglutathione lyase family enzyme